MCNDLSMKVTENPSASPNMSPDQSVLLNAPFYIQDENFKTMTTRKEHTLPYYRSEQFLTTEPGGPKEQAVVRPKSLRLGGVLVNVV